MNDLEIAHYKQRLICQRDLFSHVQLGMGYYYVKEDLRDLCEWLENKWDPANPTRQNLLIQVMRDSYKSTCVTQSFPSWALSLNPNLAILIGSKIFTNAQSFHDVQRKRWEVPEFEHIFGRWKMHNAKWDGEKCFIRTRKTHRKEASLTCAGMGTSLTSQHYDVIILDDITGPEDMYSQAEREQSYRFYKSIFDLLDKHHGLLIVVGTCWHEDDVLEKIKKQNKQKKKKGLIPFQVYHRPACDRWPNPSKFYFSWVNENFLMQIREDKADIRDFSANYLLTPLPDAYKIFHLDKLHYYDANKLDRPRCIVVFVDPSLQDTKKSDYAAIVGVSISKEGKLYVTHVDIEQRKPSVTIEAMGNLHTRIQDEYPENKDKKILPMETFWYMETVAFQQFMKDQAVNELCAKGKYVPINDYPQHKNKIGRITSAEKYCTSGIVNFRKDYDKFESYRLLMEQLSAFPMADHDDGPDALEGCINIAMQMI